MEPIWLLSPGARTMPLEFLAQNMIENGVLWCKSCKTSD